MAQIKAVSNQSPGPKAGASRKMSGVPFPYYNLEQSVEVARAMYERAGGECDRTQLATFLGYKGVNNGSFLSRVTAAKMFGLIEQETPNQLRITDRGRSVVAPVTDADQQRAMVDAFLEVELFRKVFEEYNGSPLPPDVGLRNLFSQRYQIVSDRVVPTVRVMMDSAEQAGFFRIAGNRSKMIKPIISSSYSPPAKKDSEQNGAELDSGGGSSGGGSGGGGGGQDATRIHPAIYGLLIDLPPSGGPIPAKKREKIITALTALVNLFYPDADEGPDHRA